MFLSPYFLYSDLHLLHNKQRKSRPSVEKYKIQIASIWIRESMAKTVEAFCILNIAKKCMLHHKAFVMPANPRLVFVLWEIRGNTFYYMILQLLICCKKLSLIHILVIYKSWPKLLLTLGYFFAAWARSTPKRRFNSYPDQISSTVVCKRFWLANNESCS